MQHLIEAMKRIAADVVNAQAQPRWGIVRSVDASRPAVRVELQPEGALTGWLPVLQQAAGGGLTALTVPDVGWQACVIADLGHADHGIVVGFAHSDASAMPTVPATISGPAARAAPGETVIVGPGGATVLRVNASGVFIRGPLTVDGPILASGDITDQNAAHGSMAALRSAYDAHRHAVHGVQAGGATVTTDINDHLVP